MESKLTPDEAQRFWNAIDKMDEAHAKINKLYSIIAGDEELHQIGLVQRLVKLEAQVEKMDKEITKAKGWIGGALFVGSVVGSLLTLILNTLFK